MKSLSRTALLILLLALTAGMGASGTARAGLDNLFGSKPQVDPRFPIQDDESFKANTKTYHKIPFNDTKLEFSILLPKDWSTEPLNQEKTAIDLSQKLLGDIIISRSPVVNESQAILSVQFISLEREISAENWLKNYAVSSNYSVQGKVNAVSNKRASAYFVYMVDGQITYSYAAMQMNRNVAVMMQLKLPTALAKPMGFLQKKVVDSFALTLATDDPVETQKFFSFPDAMRFSYPESWRLYYPDLRDLNNMSVQIHNVTKAGKVEGLIRFIVVRRSPGTKLKDEVAKLKRYFDEFLEIDIQKLVSSATAPVYSRFLFSRYEVYQVLPKKKDGNEKEIRFAMMGDKEWYVLLFLFAPSETEDFSAWSRDVQTFDLILKNMR